MPEGLKRYFSYRDDVLAELFKEIDAYLDQPLDTTDEMDLDQAAREADEWAESARESIRSKTREAREALLAA